MMIILFLWLVGVGIAFILNMVLLGFNWDRLQSHSRDVGRRVGTLNYPAQIFWRTTGLFVVSILASGLWPLVAPTYGMWSFGRYLKDRSQRDRSSQIETRQFKKSIASA